MTLIIMRLPWLLAVTTLTAHSLGAQAVQSQTPVPDSSGTPDIRAAEIARHVAVMAHDSMGGRDTPSRGLELTAQYVAAQFKAAGLEPAGDSSGWMQRYPIPRHSTLDDQQSVLAFVAKAKRGDQPLVNEVGDPVANFRWIDFRAGAVVASDTLVDFRALGATGGGQGSIAAAEFFGPAPLVVAGPHTVASVRQASLHDKVVVYVPCAASDSGTRRQIADLLQTSNHVIIVADEDSAAFAARRQAAGAHPPIVLDWYLPEAQRLRRWAVYAWAPAIESPLITAGFDLAEARTATTPIVRPIDAVALVRASMASAGTGPTAPNVVGMLRGARPGLIVITAHMDYLGLRRGQTNRIADGADDNASGVAALLALAKAFADLQHAGVSLGRSLVFAAVSGGAKERWGSHSLVEKFGPGQVVFNLNLDRLGRGNRGRDSVWINGLRDVELPVQPAWLAAQQPELHLTVADGGSLATESDHLAFVERMIPSLYVHRGDHGAAAAAANGVDAADTAAAVDAEQEARIVRFVFSLTRRIANASGTAALRWTAEGRRERAQLFGR